MMKVLWDALQAITAVLIIGGMFVAIPIIGLIMAITGSVAFIYLAIRDERKTPPQK